jgi:hypothetical protein
VILALLLAPLMAACDRDGEPRAIFDSDEGGALNLGDEYRFATADRETSPDEPPVIENDSLHVWVRYAGGCVDHRFSLGHRTQGDTADVWLRHDAGGDECTEDFVERLSIRLPESVLSRAHVRLVDPESDLPLLVNRPEHLNR